MYFYRNGMWTDDLFKVYRMARVLDASIDGTLTTPAAIKSRLEKESTERNFMVKVKCFSL